MKEKMTKTFGQIATKRNVTMVMSFLVLAFSVCFMPVLAADGASAVSVLIAYVLKIFQYIGILLLIWAIAQLVLAFKNEDADSKSRAMMMLMVSVLLCIIKPVAQAVINALGIEGINLDTTVDF